MSDGQLILLALIAIPIYILLFWNFVRSIIVMGKRSILWGIVAFFFSPISQIIFQLIHGRSLSAKDNKVFKLYYLAIGLFFLSGIILSVIVPALLPTNIMLEESATVESVETADTQQSSIVPVQPHDNNDTSTSNLVDENYQNIIDSAHPDAKSIVASSDFSSWLQSLQTSDNLNFNRILAEGNAEEVITMLNEFKKYKKNKQYENDIEYQEVQNIRQLVVTPTNRNNKLSEKTAEQQIEANKKTMRVFIEAEALDKKRALIRQGYTSQQAEESIAGWKQQKINKL